MKKQLLTEQVVNYVMETPEVWGLTEYNLHAIELAGTTHMTQDEIGEECGISATRVGKLVQEIINSVESRKRFKPKKCTYLSVRTIKLLQSGGIEDESDLYTYLKAGGDITSIPQIGIKRKQEILLCFGGEFFE